MSKVGSPLMYKSVNKLQKMIDEYFVYCDSRTKEIHSEKKGDFVVSDPEPYTMSGLAYALGMSRRTLLDYSKRGQFLLTIKKARERVEKDIERRMNGKDTFTPGLIFNLKNNFGWKDESKVEATYSGNITYLEKSYPPNATKNNN